MKHTRTEMTGTKVWIAILAAVTFMISPLIVTSVFADPGSLTLTTSPENSYWMRGNDADEFYYYVHVKADAYDPQHERAPLNLSLVIDKSGSMSGQKIQYAKKALAYVIDCLGPNDILSIVEYSSDVRTLCAPTFVTDKGMFHRKVNYIRADGATNLSGGMERGFQLVKQMKGRTGDVSADAKYVNRVILLSDGLANRGVTDVAGLTAIVGNYYDEYGISISTLGMGADFNEDLMASLAGRGGGRYEFISSPSQLPEIFKGELEGLSSVVAKNTEIEITFPQELVSCEGVHMYPFKIRDNKILIKLNDLSSKEQRAILINFKVDPEVTGALDFETKLFYNDVTNGMNPIEEGIKDKIVETYSTNVHRSGYNDWAGMGHALIIGGDKFKQSMQCADRRNFAQSEELLAQAEKVMEDHFTHVKPHPFLKQVYDDMKEYENVLRVLQKTKANTTQFRMTQKFMKHKANARRCSPKF